MGPTGCGKDAKSGWFRIWDRSRLLIQFAAELVAGHSGTLGPFLVVSAPGDCGPYFREVSDLIRADENKIIGRKYQWQRKSR